MLRATISKIKKMCTSAFVPRILRGDVRYLPGKFEKFSFAVLRKAEKSTKSTKDRDKECEKCKRIIELSFGPNMPPNDLDGITKTKIPEEDIRIIQDMHRDELTHMVAPQVHVKNETDCEKCSRVITESFGGENTDKNKKKDNFENVSTIPMGNIRLQATTAKTEEEKLTQKIETINETPLVGAETPKVDGFNVSPRVLGNTQSNNLNDTKTYSKQKPFQVAFKTLDESTSIKYNQPKLNCDDHSKVENEPRGRKEKAVFEDCLVEGYPEERNIEDLVKHDTTAKENKECSQREITLNIIVPNKLDETMSKHNEQPKAVINYQSNDIKRTQDHKQRVIFDEIYPKQYPKEGLEVLRSTAVGSKENTTWIQKIGESPLVEGAKPAVEEFNFPHKTIVNRDLNRNCSTADSSDDRKAGSSPETDIQVTLDELAKRCLDSPNNKIDKRLLKEMDKLGIPQTGLKDTFNSPVMDNEFVQMDVLKKPRKTVKKSEIDLETREYQHDPPAYIDKLYPSFDVAYSPKDLANNEDKENTTLKSERIQLYNLGTKPLPYSAKPSVQETAEEDTDNIENYEETKQPESFTLRPKFDLNQVIIDPYDKKTLAHDTEDYINEDSLCHNVKTATGVEERVDISKASEEHIQASHFTSKETYHVEPVLAVETSRLKAIHSEYHGVESIYQVYGSVRKNTTEAMTEQTYTPASVKEQYSHSLIQPETMVNPLLHESTFTHSKSCDQEIRKNVSAAIGPLPKLSPNKKVSLSEMLKRVRQRNHFEYCREFKNIPASVVAEGKCGKKAPPCPPPSPKCPPPEPCPPPSPPPPCPPPSPCPKPSKPACPPPCPPLKKKSPCDKFKKKCANTLGLLLDLCPQIITNQECYWPIVACDKGLKKTVSASKAILTDEVVFRLHNLGSKLLLTHRCREMVAFDSRISLTITHSENIRFTKDYEPWTPIPSWPMPKKETKRTFVCPKAGCKIIPPPKLNPPCKENPCINFPKRI